MKYFRISLFSSGQIQWHPGGIFRTTCALDVTYFPFDAQVKMILSHRLPVKKVSNSCMLSSWKTCFDSNSKRLYWFYSKLFNLP